MKSFFSIFFQEIIFEKLKKKFAVLKCHTQLSNARVKRRDRDKGLRESGHRLNAGIIMW